MHGAHTACNLMVLPLSTDLPPLVIRGRAVLPLVQGGMGVGISAHKLAGSVARLGAVGTISSVDLRRHHPDLMQATGRSRDKALINAANLTALDREVRAALAMAEGQGMVKTLQDHVKATLAPFKYPRQMVFVAALPRTDTGKLQRFKLRQI